MQLGITNEYRARIWEHTGHWWVAIETPNAVGGWYRVSLGYEYISWPKFLSETYSINKLECATETEARMKAESLLAEIRVKHDKYEAPKVAAEKAEIIV